MTQVCSWTATVSKKGKLYAWEPCPAVVHCGRGSPYLALATENRINMENQSLSQNMYFNKILILLSSSRQLSPLSQSSPDTICSLLSFPRTRCLTTCLWTLLLDAWCPLAALHTHHSQTPRPSWWHLQQSAAALLQRDFFISLYAPPPTFALCLPCFQKLKYELFSVPPGSCERLKGLGSLHKRFEPIQEVTVGVFLVTWKVQGTSHCEHPVSKTFRETAVHASTACCGGGDNGDTDHRTKTICF